MFRPSGYPIKPTVTALAALIALSGPALSGDNNRLYIEQGSLSGAQGNSLFVDQSLAVGSVVAGNLAATAPATQHGGANDASITLENTGGVALLNQTNTDPLSGTNTATLAGSAFANMVLQQQGFGNTGTLDVGGVASAANGNTGALFQFGDENTGTVNVSGLNNSGTLYQKGDGNTYTLNVDGQNTSVQWNQIGNGLATASAVAPAQVISNAAGTVTVTQRSY